MPLMGRDFEYHVEDVSPLSAVETSQLFDELAEENWELISVSDHRAYFKRQREEDEG